MAPTPDYDSYIMVDWSARSSPSPPRPIADAIWWAMARRERGELHLRPPVYERTRHAATAALAAALAAEADAGRRVLVGFDFPFGYPAGIAARICGSPSGLALWSWLAHEIADGPDNRSNRFEVAARINERFDGPGPMWGRPAGWTVPGVPTCRTGIVFDVDVPERRRVERAVRRAKPVWQLMYAGSVGSQVLLGLPALQRLRTDPRLAGRIAVWPFETGLARPEAQIVLAEIYPSLLPPHPAEPIKDAGQVRAIVEAYAARDAAGALAEAFCGPPGLAPDARREIEAEEAWILGVMTSNAAPPA